MEDWWKFVVSGLAPSGVGIAIVFLFRDALSKFVIGKLEVQLKRDLEQTKSDLRKTEALFNAEIGARKSEVETLRDTVFSIRNERRTHIDRKRIQAAENMFTYCNELAGFGMAVKLMQKVNFEEGVKHSAEPNTKLFFEQLAKWARIDELVPALKDKKMKSERLFASPGAWEYFSAYQEIIMHAVLMLHYLRSGIGDDKFLNKGRLTKSIVKLFPTSKDSFEELGDYYAYFFLDDVRENLFVHLREMVHGEESELLDLERSVELTSLVAAVAYEAPPDIPKNLRQKPIDVAVEPGAVEKSNPPTTAS